MSTLSTPPTRVEGDDVDRELDLAGRGQWNCVIEVPLRLGPREIQPTHTGFDEVFSPEHEDPVGRWLETRPRHVSGLALLTRSFDQLPPTCWRCRLEAKAGDETIMLPGAGLPWFLTLFGRDTLITAFQTVAFGPRAGTRGAHGAGDVPGHEGG